MKAAFLTSMHLVRDAYSIDCALLALLSLLAAWRPAMLAKLFIVGRDKVRAQRTFRFMALLCAGGAILAVVLRVVEKGR